MRGFLCAGLGVFLCLEMNAASKWTQMRSQNFLLTGDASERQIRQVATHLEQFRAVMTALLPKSNVTTRVPTIVVVFGTDRSFRPFKPIFNGKPVDHIAGFFQPGRDVNYISVTAEGGHDRFRIIFHEYTHLIVRANLRSVPLWFNEGLAEYYSTFTSVSGGKKVQLGVPLEHHILLLRERFLPLAELIEVDHRSALYNERDKGSIFYAESWAFMHYLITERPEGRKQIGNYLQLVDQGTKPAQAFERAFAVTPAALERELRQYVNRRVYKGTEIDFGERVMVPSSLASETMSEAAMESRLGDLLLHMNRLDEAEPRLNQAMKLDETIADAYLSLGRLRERQRRSEEAWTLLKRAADMNVKSFAAQYALGIAAVARTPRATLTGMTQTERLQAGRDALARAVTLDAGSPDAWMWLARAHFASEGSQSEARQAIEKAIELAPGEEEYRLLAARIALGQRDIASARRFLGDLVATAEEESTKMQAREIAGFIGRLEDHEKQQQALELPRQDSPEATVTRSLSRPALRQRGPGELGAYGVVERIECPRNLVIVHVKLPDRMMKLSARKFEDIDLVTFRDDVKEIGCGPQQRHPVLITWRPLENAPALSPGVEGHVVAIEILPKDYIP